MIQMASRRTSLQERYVLKEVLGKGGMGVVYRAVDMLMNREVALKTILDIENPAALDLFFREWTVLAGMVHPNVVSIYDIGEFEQGGMKKPFFVMPLLPGVTLDRLIREGSPRLTVANVVHILDQAARGLHAAHEQGLVHRDVKPSNIFVMNDDAVKIIDFGIAGLVSANAKTSVKGTLYYISPEQLEMKQPTPLSDQFALAVTAYEALTRRRPFDGSNDTEVLNAIRRHTPPAAAELNQNVSYVISQVVHKAMAKQPFHRFATIREFGEALGRALRNEALEYFDDAKLKSRMDRVRSSFDEGDYEFASEVLAEIEAEGCLDQDATLLRRQVDHAVRQRRIRQLLESARRFFASGEYPLALRKIQEALELDPEGPDALALQAQVEKERREKKIEEWIQLARQHLENQAFQQAREALGNVLKLKPNDTQALQLLAETGRSEQEFADARAEKHRLYQAAMQAWEKGEVTSALTKLEVLIRMDRESPDTDTGHSSTYEKFYNQVHSEHTAIKSAYEEARRALAANDFDAALSICRQYLARYPDHALFQALQFDIEEKQRQNLSAVIAETHRRVDQEPDLDRRMAMLEEALKHYPGEPHFERALRLVRDKRDLVNSIVAKARFFEERSQFTEALDQWQILRSIHENQPGLAFEIERLLKKRDQQAHEGAKARWVEQADRCLEAGDYDRALNIIQSALAEYPAAADLLELEKLARKCQARGAEAQALLANARVSIEKGAVEESLVPLRQAYELDPRNSVIRAVLVNSLAECARGLIAAGEWQQAEAGVRELLAMEPHHAGGQSLATRIADYRRESFLSRCVAEARRLQAEGDLARALALVAKASEACPGEPRLEQLRATLERAQAEAQRQQTTRIEQPAGVPAPPPPDTPKPPAPVPAPGVRKPATRTVVALAAGAAAVLLVIGGGIGIVQLRRQAKSPPAAATYRMRFQSNPAGAAIVVNRQPCGTSTCEVQLPPGVYEAEATLPGYPPATARFTLRAGDGPGTVTLNLQPPSAPISISTDLNEGSLTVDGAPAGQIQGGEIEIPSISPGAHTISVQSRSARATMEVDIGPGAMPSITVPMRTQSIKAFAVAHYAGSARLYSSAEGLQASLDGRPVGTVGKNALDLPQLAPGQHELVLQERAGLPRKLSFESGARPGITACLLADRNVGALRILTGEDGAEVFINGRKQRRATSRGRLLLYLPPKQYAVRVEKPGLVAPEQNVEVRRGEEAKLEFKLEPPKAVLVISRAPAGAEVWLDGVRAGSVRAGGDFASPGIVPGRHSILLKKDGFKPFQAERTFEAGNTVEIAGTMQTLTGALKLEISPAGVPVQLRLRREGESQDRVMTGAVWVLPEGTYTVTATAPQYRDFAASVRVVAGGSTPVRVAMKRLPPAPAPPPAPVFALEQWTKAGFARKGQLLVRRGGDFVLAPFAPAPGTYVFTAFIFHGKRLEWVLNYRDSRNYTLFQIDDHNFVRSDVVNGRNTGSLKTPHTIDRKGYISINAAVTRESITHSVLVGGKWKLLDKWQRPGGRLVEGKFGFRIPGRDEIGLSDFRFIQSRP